MVKESTLPWRILCIFDFEQISEISPTHLSRFERLRSERAPVQAGRE